jgi:hypothetical protein
MENSNDILDNEYLSNTDGQSQVQYVGLNKFIILSIVTLGLYEIWWMYKAWKDYQQKVDHNIMPAARAIFSIIFMYPLLNWIKQSAQRHGYPNDYNAGLLFGGFFIANFMARLPDPFWLISIASFVFFISPVLAYNYALENDPDIRATEQSGFNSRQIVLLVLGGLLWALIIAGMLMNTGSDGF